MGLEHPDTPTSMTDLVLAYSGQGRWKEAEELNIQVMETSKRVLGLEHPSTLTSMTNLALRYSRQGRWKEAEELNIQVMETRKRVLGLEHPDTLASMADLALTYSNQGRRKEAEELHKQVMNERKRVLETKPHPKAPAFSDSGYGSMIKSTPGHSIVDLQGDIAERRSIIHHELQSNATGLELETTLAEKDLIEHESDDEIASVSSDQDDIQSTIEMQKTQDVLSAEDQLRTFFMENVEISETCTKLLDRMGRKRFVTNLRRLLKKYYKSLLQSAQLPVEKACLSLLKSRFTRTRIAASVADKLRPLSDQMQLQVEDDLKKAQVMRPNVEDWLCGHPAFSLDQQDQLLLVRDSDSEPSAGSDTGSGEIMEDPDHELKHIARVKRFMTEGVAFCKLLLDVEIMLLPKELITTAQTILSIPTDRILCGVEVKCTWLDRCKIKVEQVTHTRWDWWPLAPVVYPIKEGQSRIQWHCVSTGILPDLTLDDLQLISPSIVQNSYGQMFRLAK